jgi:o-succinylbenzoate synthase
VKVETSARTYSLRAPMQAAHGETYERPLVLLKLDDGRGGTGWGEAAPLASYDGVTLDDVLAALEDCREPLRAWDGDPASRTEVLAQCAAKAVLPQAIAAVDLALWDLTGRRLDEPVHRLLGTGGRPPAVRVNATIAAADRAGAARDAAAARDAGHDTVKLKVGIGDDAGRVAAVRAAVGQDVAIRLDANGAWSVAEALAHLRVLAPAGIELCEEPVHGLAELADVSAGTSIPIALDESAALPGALDARHGTAVCLKIARCGGITGALEAARKARAVGYELYLASTFDGPLGIAAALHAASAIVPDRPCGLATLSLFDAPTDPLPTRAGQIAVPVGPGLGDGLRGWYR